MDEPFEEQPSDPQIETQFDDEGDPEFDGSAADLRAGDSLPEREQPEPTGHPVVDEVLTSLEQLDQAPVSEHVAVFEQAHEQLRRALSEAGDPAAGGSGPRPSYAGPRPRQG